MSQSIAIRAEAPPPPLDGELLTAETVRVVAQLHPLHGQRVVLEMPAGLSIEDMATRAYAGRPLSRLAPYLTCWLEGEPIPRALWPRVRPKPGRLLLIRPVPMGGGRGIFQIFLAIAAIAVQFIPGIGQVAGALIGLAIGIVGNVLLQALFPVRPPKLAKPGPAREERFSVTGVRNEPDPYGPIPVVLGRHRVYPRLGARQYTEILGNDQYVRFFVVWGYGPLDVEDIKIGETLIDDFEDVELEHGYGYDDDPVPTLYPGPVLQQDLSIDLTAADAAFQHRTTSADINEISVDFVAPQGILRIKKNGDRVSLTLNIYIRYRAVGAMDWIDLPRIDWSGRTEDTQRIGRRWTVTREPGLAYEVEVSQELEVEEEEAIRFKQIIWSALRGFRNDPPFTFAKPFAWTAGRIRASDQLNGLLDTLNGICTSRVTAFDGEDWIEDTPSAHPADLYRWALQGPMLAKPRTDGQIDLASLEAWKTAYPDFRYNEVRFDRTKVPDVLADLASAGRASSAFVDGKRGVIFDQPDAPIVQHFTPRNSWGFSSERQYRWWPHAFRVRFVNEEVGYADDERVVFDDGYDAGNATRYEGLSFPGITDPDLIWKLGRFHIAQARLRPERYSIETDFENLVCTRGDRVRITYDVPGFGIVGGRVKSTAAGPPQTVTLDEVVTQNSGKMYAVRFRLADGTSLLRSVTTVPGESPVLRLTGAGSLPDAGDLVQFGEADSESVVLRLYGIEPREDFTARLTFVDDAPEISTADSGTIPAFDSQITLPPDPFSLPPKDLRVREFLFLDSNGQAQEAALFSWRVPRFGRVQAFETQLSESGASGPWIWPGGTRGTVVAPLTSIEARGLNPGTLLFRVRCLFQDGTFSAWAVSDPAELLALLQPPPDVENFRISMLGNIATLTWDAVNWIALRHYWIKYSPLTTGATWGSASTLLNGVAGTSVQVPGRAGTYFIKAVALGDRYSVNAAMIETNIAVLAQLNVVEILQEDPDFTGDKEDVVLDGELGGLRLAAIVPGTSGSEPSEGSDGSGGEIVAEGYYTFSAPIDLLDVFTSRVGINFAAFGIDLDNDIFAVPDVFALDDVFGVDPSDWTVIPEIRFTDDDPLDSAAEWSDWQEFQISDYTARAFEFRIYMASFRAGLTPLVTMLDATVDMPDRVEGGEDLTVTVAGRRIDFDPPFLALKGVSTGDQDLATGDYKEITNKTVLGFDIVFKNAAGSPVERTFDYVAKGYGRRVA